MLLLRCKVISFQFQPKLLLHRFHNSTLRFITNSNSNSSSLKPTRYIPQNSSNQIQTLNNSINPKKNNSDSLSPGIFFGDGKKFIESEEEIKVTSKTQEDAEKIAITAIAAKALTAVELKSKLKTKGFTSDIIEKVVSNMQGRGYINDYMYAETFSRSRWLSLTWGPSRIKQALQRKGISEADVEKAAKYVFEGGGSGEDGDGSGSGIGMSKQSMDHLLVQATKQWLRGQNVPVEKKKARLVRWLQYRGFNWGVINVILKKLESQYPS